MKNIVNEKYKKCYGVIRKTENYFQSEYVPTTDCKILETVARF